MNFAQGSFLGDAMLTLCKRLTLASTVHCDEDKRKGFKPSLVNKGEALTYRHECMYSHSFARAERERGLILQNMLQPELSTERGD